MAGDRVSIEEIAAVGTIARVDTGEELRVCVKDAGHGPAIDARIYATGDGNATRQVKRGGRWVEVPAYCGPTKAGLWLTIPQAAELAAALESAVDVADRYARGLAEPQDWPCSACGAENDRHSRRCYQCDAAKRLDFLAVES
jgi:hypothetical protein